MALPLWVKFLWQDVKEISLNMLCTLNYPSFKNATFKKDVLKSQMYICKRYLMISTKYFPVSCIPDQICLKSRPNRDMDRPRTTRPSDS